MKFLRYKDEKINGHGAAVDMQDRPRVVVDVFNSVESRLAYRRPPVHARRGGVPGLSRLLNPRRPGLQEGFHVSTNLVKRRSIQDR